MRTFLTVAVACGLILPAAAQNSRPAPKKPAPQKPAPKKPAPKKPASAARPAPKPAAGPDLPSRLPAGATAVTVNGEKIPVSAYIDRLSLTFGPEVREMLIEEALVRQEAKRRKITATEKEIQALADRRFRETLQPPVETEAKLAEELKQKRGWTVADYKQLLRQDAAVQVLREKLGAALVKSTDIADADVEQFYTEQRERFRVPDMVRVSHILVRKMGEGADEQARSRADALLAKVLGGADFAQVARESSEDKLSSAGGGKLPIDLHRGAQPFGDAFEAVVFNAPEGVITEVVPSPMGYHVVRVDEKKEGKTRSLDEVREAIRTELLRRERQQRLRELLIKLRTTAEVETNKF